MKYKLLIFIFTIFLISCVPLASKSEKEVTEMKLTSAAFENNTIIPLKYTCDGENINPPLSFSDI
ncbi:MAG: YbhB/YbcL family Raf kinase inhibitor-like protein, partial [Nanoarchaeota archaeon]